jgi:hypothetical protein
MYGVESHSAWTSFCRGYEADSSGKSRHPGCLDNPLIGLSSGGAHRERYRIIFARIQNRSNSAHIELGVDVVGIAVHYRDHLGVIEERAEMLREFGRRLHVSDGVNVLGIQGEVGTERVPARE